MLDKNIYNVDFVDNIHENQMIGETPNDIPCTTNAITVQGISYSDPYFCSFKLNYKMAYGAPKYMNKSDYAFNSSVHIPIEPGKLLIRHITDDDKMSKHHDNKTRFENGDLTFAGMMQLAGCESRIVEDMRASGAPQLLDSWGVPRCLRLRAGGESSLNAASGWGSPPSSNNTGNWGGNSSGQTNSGTNNTQQWNNTAQRPPTSQADMNSNKGNGSQMPPTSTATQNWQSSPPNMPNSQPNNNGAPATNGTNGGNGNNGGANPPNQAANGNGSSPTNGGSSNNTNNNSAKIEQLNSMREALYSQDGWGGQHVNQDTNWDVPGSPEPGSKVPPEPNATGPPAWKPNVNNGAFLGTDLWEANLRNGGQPPPAPASKTPWGHTPTTNIGGTWGEDDEGDAANVWTGPPPPQQWGGAPPQHAQQWPGPKKDDWNAWGEPRCADPRLEHRGDPRAPPPDPRLDLRGGISGRLNGDMWTQHHQHAAPPAAKMMPTAGGGAGVNQWGAQGPKDSMKGAGWEEPSPPAARRAQAFDDGTSLWAGRGGMGGMRPGAAPPPARLPPTAAKPDAGAVWGAHQQRNGSWEEPHQPGWPADRDQGPWPDAAGPPLWPAQKPKPVGPNSGWPEDIGEWGGPKPPQQGPLGKQLPKELVWNSKQFRFLVEMGFKKEEAEAALRSRDMNAEEALEMLAGRGAGGGGEAWRRDEFHPGFQPPPAVPAVSPAVVQKLLNQPPPQHHQHQSYNPNSGTGNNGQPSAAQLRMLVQQIQMAVSAGYLNHQILNQPLAPQTLVLLNQLLQQIKVLQQLMQQNSLAMTKGHSSLTLQYTMQITKAKQQITALQNQIATQQALYMKQQAGGTDLFKPGPDPLAQLQNNFSDMGIAKDSQAGYGASGNQQSRLNQWKLPSLDKDGEGPEFSRAPGTAKSATSPQLSAQLGLQPDSTWGVGGRGGGEGWGEGGADVADGKDWPSHVAHQPVYDLVPEFEPGKPWKGNQMKSVEEDPAMTPGSVVRSPLSLAAIKDTEMLGGKTSPPGGDRSLSLSSTTWSYAPPGGNAVKTGGDAWSAKPRPAPPGLSKPWPQQQHHAQQRPSWQASTWLLLKNLTAQIDGSTLKTLCVQHGPLQNFHLYLNQGLALARYSTREEAAKAQMALNNCVLSNTTIFAESPADSDVQMILQHLGSGGGGAWRGQGQGKEPWPAFPALWPDSHDQRATPSSLNSFLPPDLLGGESI